MEINDLFKKFEITPSEHPDMVVTAAGNIYLTGKVDQKDTSDQVWPEGVDVTDENGPEENPEGKKGKRK